MPTSELGWLLSSFHQDWDLQYGSWEELVDSWVRSSTRKQIAHASQEIKRIVAEAETDDEVSATVWQLGCEYYAADEPGGFRGWLTAIERRLNS